MMSRQVNNLLAPHSSLGFPLYMAYNSQNFKIQDLPQNQTLPKFNVSLSSEIFKLKGTQIALRLNWIEKDHFHFNNFNSVQIET